MRKISLPFLMLATLLFAGCESSVDLSSRLRDRFEPPPPQTRLFEVDQRAVFEAAQVALRRMDFTVTRAAAAQGVVKAHSQIQPGNSMNEARQYTFDLKIEDIADGKTQVSAALREQEESAAFSGATDLPVRAHGLYDAFFEQLAAALKANLKPGTPAQ